MVSPAGLIPLQLIRRVDIFINKEMVLKGNTEWLITQG